VWGIPTFFDWVDSVRSMTFVDLETIETDFKVIFKASSIINRHLETTDDQQRRSRLESADKLPETAFTHIVSHRQNV
jgi:hypothetical protein